MSPISCSSPSDDSPLLCSCRCWRVCESRHLQSDLHQPEGRIQVWMSQRLPDGSHHRRLQGCWWAAALVCLCCFAGFLSSVVEGTLRTRPGLVYFNNDSSLKLVLKSFHIGCHRLLPPDVWVPSWSILVLIWLILHDEYIFWPTKIEYLRFLTTQILFLVERCSDGGHLQSVKRYRSRWSVCLC